MTPIGGNQPTAPPHLAGATLGEHRHVCAFFDSRDEEYRVILPFIREGLGRQEQSFQVVDPKLRTEHRRRLEADGIDVAAAEQSGHIRLYDWQEVYLEDGRFDKNRMLHFMQSILEQGRQDGFALTRVLAHAEWMTNSSWPGAEDFLEYESRLNYLVPKYQEPVVCLYDLAQFGAAAVIDVMRTHPMVIIGGVLQHNPFFVPPDQFLRELRERAPKEPTSPGATPAERGGSEIVR